MMISKTALTALALCAIAGCASVPMGDPALDASLKTFATKPGVAGLYIYRNENFGAALRMDVEVDGQPLGQTAAKTYFYKEVPPGKHVVTSRSENNDTIDVDTAGGKLYFIWQEVKMGLLYARTKLNLMGEEEGKKGVLESKLAAPSAASLEGKVNVSTSAPRSVDEQLAALKALREKDLITQEIYLERQRALLDGKP